MDTQEYNRRSKHLAQIIVQAYGKSPLVYDDLEDLFLKNSIQDLWLATTKASQAYDRAVFRDNCWLFFGKETAGLPEAFRLAHADRCVRIPMRPDARSLNLANSVAILTYEALRQMGFPQLSGEGEMGSLLPTPSPSSI